MIVLSLFLVILSACNPVVNIYKNNGKYYSIFGFLNVTSDTQFVRIEELQDSMPRSAPVHLNITVKLTDLTSGQTVNMHDSLFHFLEGTTHNYYTTEKILPLHTYRLTVDGTGGSQSSAQITMPASYPKPVVESPVGTGPADFIGCELNTGHYATIKITGVSRLVAVNAIYHTVHVSPDGSKEYRHWNIEHLADTTHSANGVILGEIDYDGDLCKTDISYDKRSYLQRVDVVVAAGNSDWPDFLKLNQETETLPGVAANVKNGVGLLGGVITDTVTIFNKSP